MALVNAVITVKGNTIITEFPKNYLDIYEELLSVESRKVLERNLQKNKMKSICTRITLPLWECNTGGNLFEY